MRVEARFRTTPSQEAEFGEAHIVPFGVTIPNIQIPTSGPYHLVLWLDNQEKATYRMRAAQVPMMVSTVALPAAPHDLD